MGILLNKINWIEKITERLSDCPDSEIWSLDGDEILCKTESTANTIANMLTTLYKAQGDRINIITGYYDPEEDKKNNEVDGRTGWWYIHRQ